MMNNKTKCFICRGHYEKDVGLCFCPIINEKICIGCCIEISSFEEEESEVGKQQLYNTIKDMKYYSKLVKGKVLEDNYILGMCKKCTTNIVS